MYRPGYFFSESSGFFVRFEQREGFAVPVERGVDTGFGAEHEDVVPDALLLRLKFLERFGAALGDAERKLLSAPDRTVEIVGTGDQEFAVAEDNGDGAQGRLIGVPRGVPEIRDHRHVTGQRFAGSHRYDGDRVCDAVA